MPPPDPTPTYSYLHWILSLIEQTSFVMDISEMLSERKWEKQNDLMPTFFSEKINGGFISVAYCQDLYKK